MPAILLTGVIGQAVELGRPTAPEEQIASAAVISPGEQVEIEVHSEATIADTTAGQQARVAIAVAEVWDLEAAGRDAAGEEALVEEEGGFVVVAVGADEAERRIDI